MKYLKTILSRILIILPDKLLNYFVFTMRQCYFPNISNPKSLNEKILHIKLYDKNPLRALVADRLKVRKYVVTKSNDVKFPKILWKGINFSSDDWFNLPNN
ncbi:MAG: hypothetical protein WCO16_02275, partial [bacterium]